MRDARSAAPIDTPTRNPELSDSHPATRIRLERVLDVGHAPEGRPPDAFDGHHIETARSIPQSVATQVGGSRANHGPGLGWTHCANRATEEHAGSRFDLDENDLPPTFEHEIKLP